MSDVLISARVPASLVLELKEFSQKNHYMDLSEAVRSILRRKWEEHSDPLAYEVGQLRRSIQDELKKGIAEKSEQLLVEELKKIGERIKDEI